MKSHEETACLGDRDLGSWGVRKFRRTRLEIRLEAKKSGTGPTCLAKKVKSSHTVAQYSSRAATFTRRQGSFRIISLPLIIRKVHTDGASLP
jgi:hypothetical protein